MHFDFPAYHPLLALTWVIEQWILCLTPSICSITLLFHSHFYQNFLEFSLFNFLWLGVCAHHPTNYWQGQQWAWPCQTQSTKCWAFLYLPFRTLSLLAFFIQLSLLHLILFLLFFFTFPTFKTQPFLYLLSPYATSSILHSTDIVESPTFRVVLLTSIPRHTQTILCIHLSNIFLSTSHLHCSTLVIFLSILTRFMRSKLMSWVLLPPSFCSPHGSQWF